MSWISGIAGKAETFLNQIDQNAATVLEGARGKGATANGSTTANSLAEVVVGGEGGGGAGAGGGGGEDSEKNAGGFRHQVFFVQSPGIGNM